MERNPNGKVPVIVEEDGFTLFEAWSIGRYLLDNKAEGNTLYPKDLKVRAVIDQICSRMNDLRYNQQCLIFAWIMAPKMGKPLPPAEMTKKNEEIMRKVY